MMSPGTLLSIWQFALKQSLAALAPELFVLLLLLAALVLDLWRPFNTRLWTGFVVLGGLLALVAMLLVQGPPTRAVSAFDGMVQLDRLGWYMRLLLAVGHALVVVQGLYYFRDGRDRTGEYYVLLLGLHLGLSFMAISNHLMLAFLSMEMASLCGYVLTAWHRQDKQAAAASLKYMLYGIFSSGVMLYGLSLVYGLAGTLRLDELNTALQTAPMLPGVVALSLLFAGFAYKAGLVPFHFWVPDVYQAAPYPIAAALSGMGKVGAFALLLRWFTVAPPGALWAGQWLHVLVALAIVSMLWGNLAAWGQTHYRRLLAYSSIGHSGLMLLAVAVGGATLQGALGYYVLVYLLLTAGAFVAGQLLLPWGEQFAQWRRVGPTGLGILVGLVVLLPGLAGLPPTAGFTAKLSLFLPLWQVYSSGQDPVVLAGLVVAVLTTVLGLYYYLKPLIQAVVRREPEATPTSLVPGTLVGLLLVLAALVLWLGLFSYDLLLGWLAG